MFHERLQAEMKKREMTPERLCVAMEDAGFPVGVGTVKSWMYGRREPGYQSLNGIVAALGCEPGDLLPGNKKAVV